MLFNKKVRACEQIIAITKELLHIFGKEQLCDELNISNESLYLILNKTVTERRNISDSIDKIMMKYCMLKNYKYGISSIEYVEED